MISKSRINDGEIAASSCEAYLEEKVDSSNNQITHENQSHAYPIFPHPKGNEFVDLDEDLKIKDLITGMKEGFDSIELLKDIAPLEWVPVKANYPI